MARRTDARRLPVERRSPAQTHSHALLRSPAQPRSPVESRSPSHVAPGVNPRSSHHAGSLRNNSHHSSGPDTSSRPARTGPSSLAADNQQATGPIDSHPETNGPAASRPATNAPVSSHHPRGTIAQLRRRIGTPATRAPNHPCALRLVALHLVALHRTGSPRKTPSSSDATAGPPPVPKVRLPRRGRGLSPQNPGRHSRVHRIRHVDTRAPPRSAVPSTRPARSRNRSPTARRNRPPHNERFDDLNRLGRNVIHAPREPPSRVDAGIGVDVS